MCFICSQSNPKHSLHPLHANLLFTVLNSKKSSSVKHAHSVSVKKCAASAPDSYFSYRVINRRSSPISVSRDENISSLLLNLKKAFVPLNAEQLDVVNAFFNALPRDPYKIVLNVCGHLVTSQSFSSLMPSEWLRGDVINAYAYILNQRNYKCARLSGQPHSYIFQSYFVSNLCDSALADPDPLRFGKKVPGGNVFQLEKMYFPVNIGRFHWTLIEVHVRQRTMQYYDSNGNSGNQYMVKLLKFLALVHFSLYGGTSMHDEQSWKLVNRKDAPIQKNGYDCGIFTCMAINFLSSGAPLTYTQNDIHQSRNFLAYELITNNRMS